MDGKISFNSQPHVRLTTADMSSAVYGAYFQFTASCEADLFLIFTEIVNMKLSIHSLMRGWPLCNSLSYFWWRLSIHSLMRGWPIKGNLTNVISILSIHSLMRGWPTPPFTKEVAGVFQFTASCEADLSYNDGEAYVSAFQFTASCEADPMIARTISVLNTFNSQPHARLTNAQSSKPVNALPFNSQPHARLTHSL